MSGQAREFTFSVDTEEVAITMSPPMPVIAQPKRRAPAPTVALRLPNLLETPQVDPAPLMAAPAFTMPPAPTVMPWTPPETAVVAQLPQVEAPAITLPAVEVAEEVECEPVVEAKPKKTAKPPKVVVKEEAEDDVVSAASEQEPLWKNPKFMLAGVAAAFLGMVSLMAMKGEPQSQRDEAPRWETANTKPLPRESDAPSADVRPPQAMAAANVEMEPQSTAPQAQPYQSEPRYSRGAAVNSFAERPAQEMGASYAPTAQYPNSGFSAEAPADESEGQATLLNNIYVPGEREASNTGPTYGPTSR